MLVAAVMTAVAAARLVVLERRRGRPRRRHLRVCGVRACVRLDEDEAAVCATLALRVEGAGRRVHGAGGFHARSHAEVGMGGEGGCGCGETHGR